MGQVVRKDKGRTVGRIARRRRIVSLDTCVETDTCQQTTEVNILARERVAMNLQGWAKRLRASAILAALLVTAGTFAGIKNMAVVVYAGSRLSDVRLTVKIVENDEDLLRTVEAIPGAVGIVDVYSINSSVKVLRVDGKLPFDLGYPLKAN